MQNVDLDRLDAMRESTTVEPSSANTMWLHEIHNAYPAIAAELRALRTECEKWRRKHNRECMHHGTGVLLNPETGEPLYDDNQPPTKGG